MHIFWIEIRSCHLGYLGCYGNDWLSTPAMNTLAGAGLVFDSHHADLIGATTGKPAWGAVNCNDPPMSLESLLADRGGQIHWLGNWAGSTQGSLEIGPLLRRLAVNKKSCLVAIGIDELVPPWELPDTPETLEAETHPDEVEPEPDILNDRDESVLEVREAYGSRIEAVDEWFGKLLEQLEDKKLLDRAAIIVTADRGISLGEHAAAGTMPAYPYEEIRHLPLIIRLPGEAYAGTRVSKATQASDMARAIFSLVDGGQAAKSESDLMSLGQCKESTRDYARTVQLSEAGLPTVAIRTPEWAFLTKLNTGPAVAELYRKPDDRWEVNNVVQHHPDLVLRLENLARAVPAP